jgi:hypothetical protein
MFTKKGLVALLVIFTIHISFINYGQNTSKNLSNIKQTEPTQEDLMSPAGRIAQQFQENGEPTAALSSDSSDECVNVPRCGRGFRDNPVRGGQAELSVATDSSGQHIVIGFNDNRGFFSNPISVSGFMYSDDGGKTFVDGGQLPTPGDVTIGTARYPQVFGDPEIKYLGGSNFIYFSIMVKAISATGTAQTMCFHRSNDYGHTWSGPFEIPSVTNPNGQLNGVNALDVADKEFADVDPDTGRVILSWTNFTSTRFAPRGVQIRTTYTDNILDENAIWSESKVVGATLDEGQGSIPRFVGNGSSNVYVAWERFPRDPVLGFNANNIGFARSTDNGETWSVPINLSDNFLTMDQVLGNDRVNNNPSMAVDNSPTSYKGNIYVVYANNDSGDGADIVFQRSTDEGISFTSPIVLNSRPGNDRAQWFPWITVDQTTGRVYVFYYDQGIADSGDLTETTYTYSDDGGTTWKRPRPLTDRPFHAGHGNDTGQPNLGDYNQAVAQNGELFATWAGTRQPDFTEGQPLTIFNAIDAYFKRISNHSNRASVQLDIDSLEFNDRFKDVGGNYNGRIDAGEIVFLKLPLTNYVTNPLNAGTIRGIRAQLSTSTPGVRVILGHSIYPNLEPGKTGNNILDFVIRTEPGFVSGTPIDLTLRVYARDGSTTLNYKLSTGTPKETVLVSENFESATDETLPTGWLSVHGAGANEIKWTTRTGFCGGSRGAFHQNEDDGAQANRNSRWERLISPQFDVPTDSDYVEVEFDVCYNTEDDPAFKIQAYDGLFLRVTDLTPGRTLRTVLAEAFAEKFTTNGFLHYPKHFPRSSDTSYFEDMSAWAGNSQGIQKVRMKLPGMAGSRAQLRFEYTQDSIGTCKDVGSEGPCGVFIDNVKIKSVINKSSKVGIK